MGCNRLCTSEDKEAAQRAEKDHISVSEARDRIYVERQEMYADIAASMAGANPGESMADVARRHFDEAHRHAAAWHGSQQVNAQHTSSMPGTTYQPATMYEPPPPPVHQSPPPAYVPAAPAPWYQPPPSPSPPPVYQPPPPAYTSPPWQSVSIQPGTAVPGSAAPATPSSPSWPTQNQVDPQRAADEQRANEQWGTLIGSDIRQFRRDAQSRIYGNGSGDHPLAFLLDENGKFKSQKGLGGHDTLADRPDIVQMMHVTSKKAGEPERVVLGTAFNNQWDNVTVESPHKGGWVVNVFVDIGGIAVELRSAKDWVLAGWLTQEVLDAAPRIDLSGD